MARFTGILGLLTMLLLAWLFSSNRRAIRWRTVLWGLGLQFVFAILVLRFTVGQRILAAAGDLVTGMLNNAFAGSQLVFGELGKQHSTFGPIIAFQVLPTIIFISALFAVLYHLGIMQIVIKAFAWAMQRTMKISGAESLNVAASIFMGQTEAPLTIRPFLPGLTRSELMTVMTSGMAHVSGGIMAAYILSGILAKDLLAAVIMTAPGTILIAKMLVPETQVPETEGTVHMTASEEHNEENLLGAIARGTIDGGRLAFNVAIMLISFLALITLLNGIFGDLHNWLGRYHIPFPSQLGVVLGILFSPVAWLIGIPWHDAPLVGNLLGTRTMINEVVAYSLLGQQKAMLAPRSFTIATFALCGFANLSSIGIQIGGIGALIPDRRNELARLGLRAMIAGTMANLMSASIVGLLVR
ncbi:NupC/NupG family nucleoside CNT transporter [Acidisarcina polymorpha]|nr:nucleoside transporter C-terminal domain-containing protein [Acidisarcina polymorpha]